MDKTNHYSALQEAVLLLHYSLEREELPEEMDSEVNRQVYNTIREEGFKDETLPEPLQQAIKLMKESPGEYRLLLLKKGVKILPELNYSSRKGDWDLLPQSVRDSMLYAYLFESTPLRELDESYLLLDSTKTKGFDSHRILHHMGVTGVFRGIFSDVSLSEGLELLAAAGEEYKGLHDALSRFGYSLYQQEAFSENDNLESRVRSSSGFSYYTTRYERSPYLRKLAIEAHGLTCMACGFNFEQVYGELGRDFIEVHHVVPLPDPRQEIIVDPERDLLCLCSNCHRMIHRNPTGILTVEELKELVVNRNLSKK